MILWKKNQKDHEDVPSGVATFTESGPWVPTEPIEDPL